MQKKVSIKLTNCYGIRKLNFDFIFENNSSQRAKSVYAIYASNGTMKSSFTKTFEDLQNGDDSKDRIYRSRQTYRNINDENGNPIKPEQIFVIHPFLEDFTSDKISLLLASKDLKEEYEKIHISIDKKKEDLIGKIKQSSKIRDNNDNESLILKDFGEKDIYICLEKIRADIETLEISDLSKIKYNNIVNSDVETFLQNEENKKLLNEYIEKFDELIEEADYLVKDVFTHNNASDISKSLTKNGFYKARHEILLKPKDGRGTERRIISSDKQFDEWLTSEKKQIFENEELITKFEKFDSAIIKNQKLRDFRILIDQNRFIIPYLSDLGELKRKLWLNYIKMEEESYLDLLSTYSSGKNEIEIIIQKVKDETTQWEAVMQKFNNRFKVPFTLDIENREDVILKGISTPGIKFKFKNYNDEYVTHDRYEVMRILSQGEKKALYLLNIIYEIEVRIKDQQETLFIIDDIADSFDYMNKYAIIEYLIDISKEGYFYQIILTHNFDFFRTLYSRFIEHEKCCIAEKKETNITLKKASAVDLPFDLWIKDASNNDNCALALIPFLRNIIEYTRGKKDPHYLKLTSMLHLKKDTLGLNKKDLEEILNKELPNRNITLNNPSDKIFDTIKICSNQCLTSGSDITLNKKIVLSLGIRLQAELFMYNKIRSLDPSIDAKLQKMQTGTMAREYKKYYPSYTDVVDVLDRVNLMTPENIHLNSFMYEPLIDMSGEHLCTLYKEVLKLDQPHGQ